MSFFFVKKKKNQLGENVFLKVKESKRGHLCILDTPSSLGTCNPTVTASFSTTRLTTFRLTKPLFQLVSGL